MFPLGYDVNEAVKGLLSNKKAGVSTERKPTHEEKLEDQKISRLRRQYGSMAQSNGDLNQSLSTEFSSVSKVRNKLPGQNEVSVGLIVVVCDLFSLRKGSDCSTLLPSPGVVEEKGVDLLIR